MALKRQYQVFITEMIKHGNPTLAYKTAYPKASDEVARVNSYRLLQNATIASAVKENAEKITAMATEKAVGELKDEIKTTVLTAERKKELLRQIAEGEIDILVKKPVWNQEQKKYVFIPVKESPDYNDRIKAIDLHNKMAGDYELDNRQKSSFTVNVE